MSQTAAGAGPSSGAIPSGNPASELATIATQGLVSNVAYGLGASLDGVAVLLENATPQCKCDLSACYGALSAASQSTSIQAGNQQAACAEANYACSPYYSSKQVNTFVPGCSAVSGTTN